MSLRPYVQVINLGLTRYQQSLTAQKHYAKELLDVLAKRSVKPAHNTVILQEHQPVYTVGLRSKDYTDEMRDKLLQTGAEFHTTNRGGLITFHGPGQLVAYPIINLKDFKLSMKCYVDRIEKTVIHMCGHYGVKGSKSPHTGVWVGNNKIAAIGVHGSRYVTTHGVAINCNNDLSWFDHIVPCGIEDKGVTSLSQELQRTISMQDATKTFLNSFQELFVCDIHVKDSDSVTK